MRSSKTWSYNLLFLLEIRLTNTCLVPSDVALFLFGLSNSTVAVRGKVRRSKKCRREILTRFIEAVRLQEGEAGLGAFSREVWAADGIPGKSEV